MNIVPGYPRSPGWSGYGSQCRDSLWQGRLSLVVITHIGLWFQRIRSCFGMDHMEANRDGKSGRCRLCKLFAAANSLVFHVFCVCFHICVILCNFFFKFNLSQTVQNTFFVTACRGPWRVWFQGIWSCFEMSWFVVVSSDISCFRKKEDVDSNLKIIVLCNEFEWNYLFEYSR